jgi:hypothetical protein
MKLHVERLREHWDTFNAVARGDAEQSALPDWDRTIEDTKPL